MIVMVTMRLDHDSALCWSVTQITQNSLMTLCCIKTWLIQHEIRKFLKESRHRVWLFSMHKDYRETAMCVSFLTQLEMSWCQLWTTCNKNTSPSCDDGHLASAQEEYSVLTLPSRDKHNRPKSLRYFQIGASDLFSCIWSFTSGVKWG